MFSEFVFVLKIKIKQAFPLLVHMRFLFRFWCWHAENFGEISDSGE